MCCQTPPEYLCSGHRSVLPSTLAREVSLCSGQQGRRRFGTGQSPENKYQGLSPQWDIYPNPSAQRKSQKRGWRECRNQRMEWGVVTYCLQDMICPVHPRTHFSRTHLHESKSARSGDPWQAALTDSVGYQQRERERKRKERKGHEREAGHVEVI